ncbi:MAG: glycosyltransferase family 2 protein [Chloroflexota bacterium]
MSIIIPSYNQAQFLEETIRSVLLQGYPNLEYIIIDGGSSDGSLDIIRKYEPWITYWVSEPDGGQSNALNKGFERATGEFLAWVNADDGLLPNAIGRVIETFMTVSDAVLVYGACQLIDENDRRLRVAEALPKMNVDTLLKVGSEIWPTPFFRRDAFCQVGLFNEQLKYCLDYDLWIRLNRIGNSARCPGSPLAVFRVHEGSKTSILPIDLAQEIYDVNTIHGGDGYTVALKSLTARWQGLEHLPIEEAYKLLQADINSSHYKRLSHALRRRSQPILSEIFAAMAFKLKTKPETKTLALQSMFYAVYLQPRFLLNRGILATVFRLLLLEKRQVLNSG